MTLLALEGLQTYYGEAHILQGVSLTVGAGEVVTLIGRNGAGKTTTLRSIMGLVPPRGGHITFDGRELTRLPTHEVARAGIAYVPEERRILPNLSVAENLRLGLLGSRTSRGEQRRGGRGSARVLPPPARALRAEGQVLSGGEQQMLAIARGLVARPKLMLVDEPTEGLSPLLVENLTEILGQINRRGTTILLVEQILEVALTLSHRLYVMDQGRIQFEGTPDELRADPDIQQRFLGV